MQMQDLDGLEIVDEKIMLEKFEEDESGNQVLVEVVHIQNGEIVSVQTFDSPSSVGGD